MISHSTCIEASKGKDSLKCVWPRYHDDLEKLVESQTYRDINIEKDRSSRMYQTRLSTTSDEIELQIDPSEQVKDNAEILVTRLENDLRRDVFPKEFVCDLEVLGKELL